MFVYVQNVSTVEESQQQSVYTTQRIQHVHYNRYFITTPILTKLLKIHVPKIRHDNAFFLCEFKLENEAILLCLFKKFFHPKLNCAIE